VAHETRNVVYEMVSENQRRGVPKDVIEAQKDAIYQGAQVIARERVKIGFLFHRIADKEGIRPEQHEFNARIAVMAQNNQMAPQKFLEELQKRQAVPEFTTNHPKKSSISLTSTRRSKMCRRIAPPESLTSPPIESPRILAG
jgi:FKBP-type peptidyl-prolyl cis-trans isomerase (trigger factor)